MFVLADIEWNVNERGEKFPTQIAALKVDDQWNVTERFDSFIRPRDESFHNWGHVSYRGGDVNSFLCARNAYAVLADFLCWLDDEDILLWWLEQSAQIFHKFVSKILKTTDEHKFVAIGNYVHEFLAGHSNSHGNAYKLAEVRGIDTNSRMKHCAANDVRVMHLLLEMINYPQDRFLKPLLRISKTPSVQNRPNTHLRYQYDPTEKMIHLLECDKYDHSDMTIKGYPNLDTAIRKHYRICSCCKSDYRATLRARNSKVIAKMLYTYIYTPSSDVFHRYDCGLVLNAKSIMGTRYYQSIMNIGKVPCKVCKPTSLDRHQIMPQNTREMQLSNEENQSDTSEVSKAIRRHKIAVKDRARLLNNSGLTKQEIKDIYTLTQPRFAFWASTGYITFHQRGCSKLKCASDLKGFSLFSDAIRAGFRPCRHCKPTEKQNITLSIPITSRQRSNERIEDLEPLCKMAGYPFDYENQFFCLETPVGKWRINTSTSPIKLKHINLVKSPNEVNYHDQPRLFLSFVDVFDYIKRHDEELMKKSNLSLNAV